MVYRLIKYSIIFIFLLPLNLFSNVVYDKNDILITNLDLDNYKQLYYENYGRNIN